MENTKIKEKSKIIVENIEGYVKRKVTKFGNGAKVDCPKEYLGKDVYLIITK